MSVVVRTFNSERYVSAALESIRIQKLAGPLEIVVCYDKGSTDGTLRVLGKFSPAENQTIQIIEHEHTTPFRATQVHALPNCSGQYVAFLDSDNILPPDYLQSMTTLALSSGVEFLFANSKVIDADGADMNRTLENVPRNYREPAKIAHRNYIDINSIFASRRALEQIWKMLDLAGERYFDDLCEDWLIGMLAIKHCNTLYAGGIFSKYRIHSNNLTTSAKNDPVKVLLNCEKELKTLMAYCKIEGHALSAKEKESIHARAAMIIHSVEMRAVEVVERGGPSSATSFAFRIHRLVSKAYFQYSRIMLNVAARLSR